MEDVGGMNIFLPYESNIVKSVQSLDDSRLIKQIQECWVMHTAIVNNYTKGYINHPVTQFYKNNPSFIATYGAECCIEYNYRFGKFHKTHEYFLPLKMDNCEFVPFYASGSKATLDCVRTTENVSKLFREKLFLKWFNDKRQPRWTKRESPTFKIKL